MKKNTKIFDSLILFTIGIITRLPFQSKILHEWDSINFALALDKFDLSLHQPHPPGMFLFFILLGRLCRLFLPDGNASLIAINILATGLSAVSLYWLGSLWYGRKTGLIIALLMLSSPLVWFQGEVALSYMLEFLWVILIIICCYQMRSGNKLAFVLALLLLGLSGGIRPNTIFFLSPLCLGSFVLGWRDKYYKIWHFLIGVLIVILGVICWLIPMIMLSDGFIAFWELMQSWSSGHSKDGIARGFEGVYLNLKLLLEALLYGVGFSIIPIIWIGRKNWKQIKTDFWQDWRLQTLALWLTPGLIYLIFIHVQRLGHTFTLMPAFIIIGGVAMVRAIEYLQSVKPKANIIIILMVLLGNILFFLFYPGKLDNVPTWQTIRDYDAYISERLTVIKENFTPGSTMVLTRGRNGRIREYYLPEYQGSARTFTIGDEIITLPDTVQNLVFFDDGSLPKVTDPLNLPELVLPTQGKMKFLRWKPDQQVKISKQILIIEKKGDQD